MDIEMDLVFDTDSDDDDEELAKLEQLKAVLDEEDDEPLNESLRFGSSVPAWSSQRTSTTTKPPEKLSVADKTIAHNKLLQEKLARLEREIVLRLRECRLKLQAIQINAPNITQGNKGEAPFRYINCGRPYFKDKMNFPAPDNEDAKLAKSEMYDFSLAISVPGWTVRDKSNFITMIHKMSIDIAKNKIDSKIAEIKRKNKGRYSKQVEKEIQDLKAEAEVVSKRPLSQIALPIHEEYDWDLLANKLNRRHTAQEYQSLWKLFFHPTINKNSWSKDEHVALQRIASENNQQDWDDIARKLNTGRTGYQCFVYYRTNMSTSFNGKKWTQEEITYLKRLIDYFKEDNYIPWGKIAAAMGNRTKIQIYNKHMRLIEQRKGRFLPEEDAVILNCVERFGTNFKRMTNYLPGRSMVQTRARYQVLSKMRVSTVWTVEDDRKLIQIMTNQDSMNFSIATQHFPGRNRVKIRSRYITLMKWMKKHPNLDLEHAPRRGARRLNHGQATDNLNKAIENLKHVLNSEVETKSKKKKINLQSNETEIEDAIVATLVNELVKKLQIRRAPIENQQIHIGINNIVTSVNFNMTNLRKCLILLNARLNQVEYFKSKYNKQYPNLGDNDQDVSLIKVKSYSRMSTSCNKSTVSDVKPNVWGNPTLSPRNYVFPPHYATITGCRALLSLVSSAASFCESVNLHVLVRRNSILKEQLDQLLERFYILFTWPMVLSNEGPSEFKSMKDRRIESAYIRPPTLPNAPEVAINVKSMNIRKYKTVEVTDIIDLHNEGDNGDEVAVEEKNNSKDNEEEDLSN